MHRISLTLLLVALAAMPTAADPEPAPKLSALIGEYRRSPVENGWHAGRIAFKKGKKGVLQWTNEAGRSWDLIPDLANGRLETGPSNPYFASGGRAFRLLIRKGRVVGFRFLNEVYVRKGATILTQRSGGLKGYISMQLPVPKDEFRYGMSFYASIWRLVEKPLGAFQIGLPSTWIVPENRDFTGPLCPHGTVARDSWPERGPTYAAVFQTIEGGLGYWGSTRFGASIPKYRMNGTPSCYNHEVSSPGWGFGRVEALPADRVGIAQLSNSLLVPPDGLTFQLEDDVAVLGNAWMALPLTRAHRRGGVTTGAQCWTLFLNAANFKGPVAFWVPETWSRMSRTYKAIDGRGLDARPGAMGSGAMEVNTVPYFEATRGGKTYSRIPRLQFPVDERGRTYLMQDVTMYGKAALHDRMASWVSGGEVPSGRFAESSAHKPKPRSNPITFRQGSANKPLEGFKGIVKTEIFEQQGAYSFGLQWEKGPHRGVFPEYYRSRGKKMVVVAAKAVPAATALDQEAFLPAHGDAEYTSPTAPDSFWQQPGPSGSPSTIQLSDGSELTYAWYRFVDQPVIRALEWSEEKRRRIQARVEAIHRGWTADGDYLAPPSRGKLVVIDPALRVKPPKGMEFGYVPIATAQRARD